MNERKVKSTEFSLFTWNSWLILVGYKYCLRDGRSYLDSGILLRSQRILRASLIVVYACTQRNWQTWRFINAPRDTSLRQTRFTSIELNEKFTDSARRQSSRAIVTTTSSLANNSISPSDCHRLRHSFTTVTTNKTNSPNHVPRQRPTSMEQIIRIIAQKALTVSTLSGLGFHNFSSSRGPCKSIGSASKSGKRISAPEDWTQLSVSC